LQALFQQNFVLVNAAYAADEKHSSLLLEGEICSSCPKDETTVVAMGFFYM
jgi:hypothetical protein